MRYIHMGTGRILGNNEDYLKITGTANILGI